MYRQTTTYKQTPHFLGVDYAKKSIAEKNRTNYTTFGAPMPERTFSSASYKYGFNGKEKTDEVNGEGAVYDYGFRIYDSRLGRFLSIDPLTKSYPWYTPYQFAGNKPIMCIDLDGAEDQCVNDDCGATEPNTQTVPPPANNSKMEETAKASTTTTDDKKDVKDLTTSEKGLDFIRSYEGFKGDMYDDATGNATIGYGHLVHYGKMDGKDASETAEFKKGGMTKERAEEIFKEDVKKLGEDIVKKAVTVKLTQEQFDALVSFTFNVGSLAGSTLVKKVNESDASAETIKAAFLMWNKGTVDGKLQEIPGLTNRRTAEAEIYNNGKYVNN